MYESSYEAALNVYKHHIFLQNTSSVLTININNTHFYLFDENNYVLWNSFSVVFFPCVLAWITCWWFLLVVETNKPNFCVSAANDGSWQTWSNSFEKEKSLFGRSIFYFMVIWKCAEKFAVLLLNLLGWLLCEGQLLQGKEPQNSEKNDDSKHMVVCLMLFGVHLISPTPRTDTYLSEEVE